MASRTIWVCWMMALEFGCSSETATQEQATDILTMQNTLSIDKAAWSPATDRLHTQDELTSELHDVLAARWEGFREVAQNRPDNDVLAVELTRTLNGETAVVFTVARSDGPARYAVLGDENGNVTADERQTAASGHSAAQTEVFAVGDDLAIDPSVIALGIPPPQEPGTPGFIAAGAALLTEVFAPADDSGDDSMGVERMERALRAIPVVSPLVDTDGTCGSIDKTATEPTALRDVLVARWKGFQQLATKQPNHHILAVELIRALDGETIAAFTVVKNGEPARYVVAGDTRGRLTVPSAHCVLSGKTEAAFWRASELPDVADPAAIALEEPPVKEPGRPGIIAAGGQLLSAAFGGSGMAGLAPKQ